MGDDTEDASFKGDPPAAAESAVLADRRELALVAVERTRMPMVVTDPRQPDSPIVLANQAFLDLTGYTADEVIGRNCRFLQGPDTDPAAVEAIRRGFAANLDNISVELLNYRKDGTSFWNQLSVDPVVNEAGEVIYYFGLQKDVSARRRIELLEETERLLLMEVDHRAMNALALVESIVGLSRAETIAGYAGAIMGRVKALSQAHRMLARSGWLAVELGELLAAEATDLTRDRVTTNGAPLQLPPRLVQPMALVLHELMSNAVEHGALAHTDGTVMVSWAEQPAGMILVWREHGAQTAGPPAKQGFGLKMLTGLIERQLGGRVATSWPAQGFRVEMTMPIPEKGRSSVEG